MTFTPHPFQDVLVILNQNTLAPSMDDTYYLLGTVLTLEVHLLCAGDCAGHSVDPVKGLRSYPPFKLICHL